MHICGQLHWPPPDGKQKQCSCGMGSGTKSWDGIRQTRRMNERSLCPSGSAHCGQLHQGSHKQKVTHTHPQGTQISGHKAQCDATQRF